jgi:hypothetical protein
VLERALKAWLRQGWGAAAYPESMEHIGVLRGLDAATGNMSI